LHLQDNSRKLLEVQAQAAMEMHRRALLDKTVYSIVSADKTILRTIQRDQWNKFVEVTGKTPTVQVPEKLEPVLTRPKKYIIIYGGRGGAKSITVIDILAAETKDDHSKTMCFREIQKSLQESVYTGFEGEINRLGLLGYTSVQNEIRHGDGGLFSFWGLKANLSNMKSLYGYKRFWTEEAEITSQKSLDTMGPTLRGVPGANLIFTFNPRSSADPIYQAFIKPFEKQLNKEGIYEDDWHLIIKIGHEDNPWFNDDETLKGELDKDRQKVKDGFMTQNKFNHIWGGEPDDNVENAIISTDMFDACIDAHIKLGFKARGAKIVAHDPSDLGHDDKGYAARQGSVVTSVVGNDKGDVNEGCEWSTDKALDDDCDVYRFDADGMGSGLKRQVSQAFNEHDVEIEPFNGSDSGKGMLDANVIYEKPESVNSKSSKKKKPKSVKETFKNDRSYNYWLLRDRCYYTYRAVRFNEYIDPDKLISFDSKGVENMAQLRAEICRIPLKKNANGLIQIMSKDDMLRLLEIESPNLADSVMMLMAPPPIKQVHEPLNFTSFG